MNVEEKYTLIYKDAETDKTWRFLKVRDGLYERQDGKQINLYRMNRYYEFVRHERGPIMMTVISPNGFALRKKRDAV